MSHRESLGSLYGVSCHALGTIVQMREAKDAGSEVGLQMPPALPVAAREGYRCYFWPVTAARLGVQAE